MEIFRFKHNAITFKRELQGLPLMPFQVADCQHTIGTGVINPFVNSNSGLSPGDIHKFMIIMKMGFLLLLLGSEIMKDADFSGIKIKVVTHRFVDLPKSKKCIF